MTNVAAGNPSASAQPLFTPAGWKGEGQPPLYTAAQIAALIETKHPTHESQADSQPAEVWGYPPLPDFDTVEQHIYGACRRYIAQDMLEPIHNLIRDVIDADRAARKQGGK